MPDYPRPTWEQFKKLFKARWQQGEHVFINGQTGSGKTELMMELLNMPWGPRQRMKYSTLFVTKPRDPIFKSDAVKDWSHMTKFEPQAHHSKILISAPNGSTTADQVYNQKVVFSHALDSLYAQKGWTVGFDETLWLTNTLKLGGPTSNLAFMGRALGLTGVYATQRPAHIPVLIPQSCSHAFLAKTGRQEDLKRMAELGGDVRETRVAIDSLRDQHDFVYVDTQGKLPIMIVNTQR